MMDRFLLKTSSVDSLIINFVSFILQNIIYEQVVEEVWKDLKEHFSQGDVACVAELTQNYFVLSKDPS